MNKAFTILLILAFFSCKLQRQEVVISEIFQWEIALPLNFNAIELEKWEKLKNNGKKLIMNTTDIELIDLSTPIFILDNGEFNRFDANYMSKLSFIEPNTTFLESFNTINTIAYNSFKKIAPEAEIDTITSTENIDGLEFLKFEITTKLDHDFIIKSKSYKRLFDDKVLSINIVFLDEDIGNEIMKSLRSSRFK